MERRGFHHAGDLQSRGEDSIEGHFFSNPRCSESCVWGLPFMTSANISDFSDPPFPLVTYRNQLILFLSSAFWGPPFPSQFGRHTWNPPDGKFPRVISLSVTERDGLTSTNFNNAPQRIGIRFHFHVHFTLYSGRRLQ